MVGDFIGILKVCNGILGDDKGGGGGGLWVLGWVGRGVGVGRGVRG